MIFPKCTSQGAGPPRGAILGCVMALRMKPHQDQPGKLAWPGASTQDLSVCPELQPVLPALGAAVSQAAPALCPSVCLGYSPPGPAGDRAFSPLMSATPAKRPSRPRDHGSPPLYLP